jgi:exodeoxyribonuclease VII large subunit
MVVSRKDDFCARIDRLSQRVTAAMRGRVHRLEGRMRALDLAPRMRLRLGGRERRYQALRLKLQTFDVRQRLSAIRTRLVGADGRLAGASARAHHRAQARLGAAAARLDSLSPLAVLGRGYAVCWNGDRTAIIRDAGTVSPGERVRVTLERGELGCVVDSRQPAAGSRQGDTET